MGKDEKRDLEDFRAQPERTPQEAKAWSESMEKAARSGGDLSKIEAASWEEAAQAYLKSLKSGELDTDTAPFREDFFPKQQGPSEKN